jgi:protein-tyrosine phosphatase
MNNDNRHIPLEGAFNFREIGGLKTSDGRVLKSGLLFRSDELSKLTKNDLDKFAQLKIKTVVDLRTQNERDSRGDNIPKDSNIKVINISLSHQSRNVNYFQLFWFLTFRSGNFDFEQYIKDHYHSYSFECRSSVNQIFTLLSNPDNLPALLHCTVGKDRSGFISALIQLLCGVDRSVVLEDYMLTNVYAGPRIRKISLLVRWISLFRIKPERMQPLFQAIPEYLNSALDNILSKYDSIEDYLVNAINLDNDVLSKLKNNILE